MNHLIEAIVRRSGLQVQHGNRERVQDHIQARVKALGLEQPEAFLDCLEPESPHQAREVELLAEVLTTGETFFMRDAGQMQFLRETLLPELVARRRAQGQLWLRLWSSACASGEEAYSLAILLHELLPDRPAWRIDLYGTDVSRGALRRAQAGVYGAWAFRGCDEGFRRRHFHPHGDHWRLQQPLRDMVRFLPCDLIQEGLPDPGRGLAEMDLILCRNLFIYLDPAAIEAVTHKLTASLSEGGILLTGHGELRNHRPAQLQVEMHPQTLVYRKGGAAKAARPRSATTQQGRDPKPGTLKGPPPAPPGARPTTSSITPSNISRADLTAPVTLVPPSATAVSSAEYQVSPQGLTRPTAAIAPAPRVQPVPHQTSRPRGQGPTPVTARPSSAAAAIAAAHGPAPATLATPATPAVAAVAAVAAPAAATKPPRPHDLSRAWRLADAGRLREAQELCERLRAQDPLLAEPHFLAAVLAEELGEIAAARDALRKAIYLEPTLIAAHVHLERLQTAAVENEAARKTRETLLRLLGGLPAEARVPLMGDTQVEELVRHFTQPAN